MDRFNLKIDLASLDNAFIKDFKQSATGNKVKCVVIPVEANDIFVSQKGGAYLSLTAYPFNDRNGKQSHLLKKRLSKEKYASMTREEKFSLPIVGSIDLPYNPNYGGGNQGYQPAPSPNAPTVDFGDDIPF